MEKKQYLIAILEKIQDEWLPARWLIYIAKEWKLSDEMIDIFVQLIQESLKAITNKELKETLTKSLTVLENVKKLEAKSKQHDQEDLDKLDELLETL